MHKLTTYCLFLLALTSLSAAKSQSIQEKVINTTSFTSSIASTYIDISIGEPIVDVLVSGNNQYTLGFLQPDYALTTSIYGLDDPRLKAYPNPVNEYVFIESDNKVSSITIYEISGVKLKTYENISDKLIKIDLEEFSSGVLIFTITLDNMDTITKKFIKL